MRAILLTIALVMMIATSGHAVVDQLDDGTWIEIHEDGSWTPITNPNDIELIPEGKIKSFTMDEAINVCKTEIASNFDQSVNIRFPEPLTGENENAYFVHYKEKQKLYTGNKTRVDARCTILKTG